MNQPLALVIDDEPDICELLTLTLGRMDIRTETATDVAGAKALLGKHEFDICLTDMRLPDGDGLDLVDWMQTHAAGVPVAALQWDPPPTRHWSTRILRAPTTAPAWAAARNRGIRVARQAALIC